MQTIQKPSTWRKSLFYSLLFVFIFSLIAHGSFYLNTFFSHDSLLIDQATSKEALWQISLGRFSQPAYTYLRGGITSPLWIGFLSMLFLGLATYEIVQAFQIKDRWLIILTAGIFSTNTTVIFQNASYLPWVDIYALAFFLMALSVRLFVQHKYGFLFVLPLTVLSIGFYQSYLSVLFGLLVLVVLKDIFNGKPFRKNIQTSLKAIALLGLSILLYYLTLQLTLRIFHVTPAAGYNSVSNIIDFKPMALLKSLYKTYARILLWFYVSGSSHYAAKVYTSINIALTAILAYNVFHIVKNKKIRTANVVLGFLCAAVLPLALNFIMFINSKSLTHELMTYSYFLWHFLVLYTTAYQCEISSAPKGSTSADLGNDRADESALESKDKPCAAVNWAQASKPKRRLPDIVRIAATLLVGVFLFTNASFSNQLYTKKQLEYSATLSLMTRIVDQIEHTDGYQINQTPILFIGDLNKSELNYTREGFESLCGIGTSINYSTSFEPSYSMYLSNILGYPHKTADEAQQNNLRKSEAVREMACYPNPGSIALVDGVIVVKLSAE